MIVSCFPLWFPNLVSYYSLPLLFPIVVYCFPLLFPIIASRSYFLFLFPMIDCGPCVPLLLPVSVIVSRSCFQFACFTRVFLVPGNVSCAPFWFPVHPSHYCLPFLFLIIVCRIPRSFPTLASCACFPTIVSPSCFPFLSPTRVLRLLSCDRFWFSLSIYVVCSCVPFSFLIMVARSCFPFLIPLIVFHVPLLFPVFVSHVLSMSVSGFCFLLLLPTIASHDRFPFSLPMIFPVLFPTIVTHSYFPLLCSIIVSHYCFPLSLPILGFNDCVPCLCPVLVSLSCYLLWFVSILVPHY